MAQKDFFASKRGRPSQRKSGDRSPKPNSFLIVSEGTKTEPLYFEGLADFVNSKYGNRIDVEKPTITPIGEGKSTVNLVNETKKIAARSKVMYNQVWVVFDKDEFTDFDKAITLAEDFGYKVAWNNQSFEYWIFLHFHYSDSAIDRDDWEAKISDIFKRRKINPNGYHKNDPKVFKIATEKGSLKDAIKRAQKIESTYPKGTPASRCDPCTKVHHLILELEPFIEELL